ncbi:hypothetical protein JCM5350_004284 [Sporobolomyces pararoseus]
MTRFSRLAPFLFNSLLHFNLLSHILLTSAQAKHSLGHSIDTPAHLLAKRNLNFPRSLLEGQLTVGSLLNASITVAGTSRNTSEESKNSTSSASPVQSTSCFPFRSNGFVNETVPSGTKREDWWCKEEDIYGFLEISDCSDPSNQFNKINNDLKRMKEEFGATFVRPYGVECRELSVWLNLVRACIELGMALIVQVWWGFQQDMNSFGIPVGISEDWDRPQRMKQDSSVIGIGESVLDNTDVAQLHVMPYYHPDEVPTIDQTWDYIKQQVIWARNTLRQPTMITEVGIFSPLFLSNTS